MDFAESAERIGWFDSPIFDEHISPDSMHPESPARLHAIRDAVTKHDVYAQLARQAPSPIHFDFIRKIHTDDYVERLAAMCSHGGGRLDPDTSCVPRSWDAATHAAGAVVDAVDSVVTGKWQRAFCSVRPPGHHALSRGAMGFCLLNNIAIGAQSALEHPSIDRVAILDWDVHHGNGTQEIFWNRSDVFYASMHQFPFYPGTGAEHEAGAGHGLGRTVNCPLAMGSGDTELLAAWTNKVRPALETFKPHILLISAGFDGDRRDPLGGLNISAAGFETLSAAVVEWSNRHCNGQIVSVLEGGYDLEALGEDVRIHLETLVM